MKNLSKKHNSIFALGILCIVSFLFLGSCERVDEPIAATEDYDSLNFPIPTFEPNDNDKRFVLLEDYTGHTCGNCPVAHEKAEEVRTEYAPQLILVSVHAGGNFADPDPNGCFDTDYRTEAGEEYENYLGINFNPVGTVSRIEFGGSKLVTHIEWETKVNEITDLDPDANIQVKTNYKSSLQKFSVNIEAEILNDLTGEYGVIAYVVEDSIIDCQKVVNIDVEDYLHRHVLRANVNGTWGELLSTTNPVAGTKQQFHYIVNVKPEWNDHHLLVVAYVYDTSTGEILQVTERHV